MLSSALWLSWAKVILRVRAWARTEERLVSGDRVRIGIGPGQDLGRIVPGLNKG